MTELKSGNHPFSEHRLSSIDETELEKKKKNQTACTVCYVCKVIFSNSAAYAFYNFMFLKPLRITGASFYPTSVVIRSIRS